MSPCCLDVLPSQSSTDRGRQCFLQGRLGCSQDRLCWLCRCLCVFNQRLENNRYPCPSASRTQEKRGENPDYAKPHWTRWLAPSLRVFLLLGADRRSSPLGAAAGWNHNVFAQSVTAVGLCVYMKQAGLMGLPLARLTASGQTIAAIHARI